MFIVRVKVSKLYGLHDYDIHFEEEACLKIIHAPNGYGKTTILKMISAVLEGEIEALRKVPFKNFIIFLNTGMRIKVVRDGKGLYYKIKDQQDEQSYEVSGMGIHLENEYLVNQLTKLRMIMPDFQIGRAHV